MHFLLDKHTGNKVKWNFKFIRFRFSQKKVSFFELILKCTQHFCLRCYNDFCSL